MTKMKSGLPFLYDDSTGDLVGVKDQDGSEKILRTNIEITDDHIAALAASGITKGSGGVARSNIIAVIGDSRVEQCTVNSATLKRYPDNSFAAHAISHSRNNLTFPLEMNFGVGGDTTVLVLARLDAAITSMVAGGVRFCGVLLGTNDIVAASRTVAAVTIDLTEIYRRIRTAGITVCAFVETPRSNSGSGVLSAALRKRLAALSNFIRKFCAENDGMVLVDYTKNMIDYAATGADIGDPIGASAGAATAVTYDGLHPSCRGAYWMGKAWADALADMLQASRNSLFTNPIDVYHATDNPLGNILTNGTFVGSAGGLAGGATGTSATSFTLQKTAGAGTVVGSATTESTESGSTYGTQTIVTSGAASAKLYEQLYSPSSFTVGDVVYGECEVKITSATNMTECFMQVDDGTVAGRSFHPVGGFYWPDGSYTVCLRTPNITLESIAAVTWYLQVSTAAAGGVTAEVMSAAWRKVQ